MLAGAQMLARDSVLDVPVEAKINPEAIPLFLFFAIGANEELHRHLLELAGAENKILMGHFVAERFPLMRDAKRQLNPLRIEDIIEIRENSLRGFRTKINYRRGLFDWSHERLEHQVEI